MGLKELNANKKILKFKALYRKPNFYSYMCSTRRTTYVEGFYLLKTLLVTYSLSLIIQL